MAMALDTALAHLLEADPADIRRVERLRFDQWTEPFGASLVLFGAGRLGRRIARYLKEQGIQPVAFADNNPAAWGTRVEEVPVLSAADAVKSFGNRAAFIVTIRHPGFCFETVRQQLAGLGCTRVIPYFVLYWKYAEAFLPHFFVDLPHRTLEHAGDVMRGWELWADEVSKREYYSQLRLRLEADYSALSEPAPDEYFPEGLFTTNEQEVFVDCGAFDGDTVRDFLRRRRNTFRHITAIEPDPANAANLQAYVSTLAADTRNKITVRNLAVSARAGTVTFQASGSVESGISSTGNLQVECARLDDLCRDQPPPTFIKLDIEGAEPDALEGARETILRHRPILAVCLYHHPNHLWQIPLWIQSLGKDYRFHLRSHDYEGWDVVCYAIPPERCP